MEGLGRTGLNNAFSGYRSVSGEGRRRPCWRAPVWCTLRRLFRYGMEWASARRAHGGCLGAGGRGRTRPRGEMLRGGAGGRGSGGIRMGQPARGTPGHRERSRGEPRELKHLSTARKREDSLSSGERRGRSPNRWGGTACRRCPIGVGRGDGRARQRPRRGGGRSRRPLERVTAGGESPVGDAAIRRVHRGREYRRTRGIRREAGAPTPQG